MDKVQFHCDPEFKVAVSEGEKVNLNSKGLSFAMIDRYPHFSFDIPPAQSAKEKRKNLHPLQTGIVHLCLG